MAICPNCGHEVNSDYRFCQRCGFKLWKTWGGKTLSKLFGSVGPGNNVHRLAQNNIWKIGKDLGFHSVTDFVPPSTVMLSRSQLIDVVWKTGDNVEFAFEICSKENNLDVVINQDDVVKLRNLDSQKKFLVNISSKTGKAYFNEIVGEIVTPKEDLPANSPLDKEITAVILNADEISKRIGRVQPGKDVRQQLEFKLQKMGSDVGFSSYTWYEVPNLLRDGRNRFISVIWKTGSQIEVAFQVRRKRLNPEIVTSHKDKSKMLSLISKEKYIVNVSERTGEAYFFKVTASNCTVAGEPEHKDSLRIEDREKHTLDVIRIKHPRAYESWTLAEDSELERGYREGSPVSILAQTHQRQKGAIRSRLKKLGLLGPQDSLKTSNAEKNNFVTILAKSDKRGRVCLAGIDENRQWVRPIKPGGFLEEDLVMKNGEILDVFDVVEMKFDRAYPIKHHRENMLLATNSSLSLAVKLGEESRKWLLSVIAEPSIFDGVGSRDALYDKMVTLLHRSLAMAGPIDAFEIQSSRLAGKNHPRIWVLDPTSKQRIFYIPCTDIEFCKFVRNKLAGNEADSFINSQEVPELKNKKAYFVIGLTGDALDESGNIKDGKYAPPESAIQPRYWPLVVSVLTVPNFIGGTT